MSDVSRLRLLALGLRVLGVRSQVRRGAAGAYLVAGRPPVPVSVSVRVRGGAVLWMDGDREVVLGRRLLPAVAVLAWLCSMDGMAGLLGWGVWDEQ